MRGLHLLPGSRSPSLVPGLQGAEQQYSPWSPKNSGSTVSTDGVANVVNNSLRWISAA